MSKPLIATTSLAGCFGCHMSIMDLDDRILQLIELIEFNKSPINDIKNLSKECDIGIIEGGCANNDNIRLLKEFRKSCRLLIAVGECAIMGGLPAMRNNSASISECLQEAYIDCVSVQANDEGLIPNDEELPMLLDRIYPCHEIVKIDYSIPGCAPRADLIWDVLTALISGKKMELSYEYFKFD